MIEVYNEVHLTHSPVQGAHFSVCGTCSSLSLQQTMLAAVDCSRDILQLL